MSVLAEKAERPRQRLVLVLSAASIALVAGALLALFVLPGPQSCCAAETVSTQPDPTVAANGTVRAIAGTGDSVIIGGDFIEVGPVTGPGVGISSGGQEIGLPRVAGDSVEAVVSDGRGGWYVGGRFFALDGIERSNLAHILSDGALDPDFDLQTNRNGFVYSLARAGDTLYLGGSFTTVAGQSRNRLAAIDTASGELSDWNPGADNTVRALATAGESIYAGGDFAQSGGAARSRIAAIDADGTATEWNPTANATVRALAIAGEVIYAGGDFTAIGANDPQPARAHVAALDLGSGKATEWTADTGGAWGVYALAATHDAVYLGGLFSTVDGTSRGSLAAADHEGDLLAWNPSADGFVESLVSDGQKVYAGGDFDEIGAAVRNGLAEIDADSGEVSSWNPKPQQHPRIVALAFDGSSVYAGGSFRSINVQPRSGLAAYDFHTGALLPWAPAVDGAVHALVLSGSTLYLGGYFSRIGGADRRDLAAIDIESGAVKPFRADLNLGGSVESLALAGSTLYVGGHFTSLGGESRKSLGAVDAASGAARSFAPEPDAPPYGPIIDSLLATGTTVYVGGNFTAIGGENRSGLVALDPQTGRPTEWAPNPTGFFFPAAIIGMELRGSTLYVVGGFNSIGGQSRLSAAALDTASAAATAWDPSPHGAVLDVAVAGTTAYVGGGNMDVGDRFDAGLFATDATSGALSDWDPRVSGYTRDVSVAPDGSPLVGGEEMINAGLWPAGNVASFPVSPANESAPEITGTPEPGNELTCQRGAWTGRAPLNYEYRWMRNDNPIAGATASTWPAGAADIDHAIACEVTVTNALGSAGAQSAAVTVREPPPRPPQDAGAGTSPPASGRARLAILSLTITPGKFRAAKSGGSIARARGARVSYELSRRASTRMTVERARPGRKVGGRCVKRRPSNAKRKRCTRYVVVKGSFTHGGKTGKNTFRFTGRLSGKRLRAGRYRLVAVARTITDRSAPKRAAFTIKR